jgi:hypothetical protein
MNHYTKELSTDFLELPMSLEEQERYYRFFYGPVPENVERIDLVTTLLRLPDKGPIAITDGGDRLEFTVPVGTGVEGLMRSDAIAKRLMKDGEIQFCAEVVESAFVAKKMEEKTWGGLRFVNIVMDSCVRTIDVPGPFSITARGDGFLFIHITRGKRK